MAKVTSPILTLTGKMDKDVYIDSRKYGYYKRKAVAAGLKTDEPALKQQYTRTKFLNKLAGELNRVMAIYAGDFKSSDLYQKLQRHFRRERLDNRFLLLLQLKGMQVNSDHPLYLPVGNNVAVTERKDKIAVSLAVNFHPNKGKYHADCYYYEVLLLSWAKSKEQAIHSEQLSEWIRYSDGKAEFEFVFPKRVGTTHWLLCLRLRLGVDEKETGSFRGEGMQIVDVGTFDKKELALAAKRESEDNAKSLMEAEQKPVTERVRVKAKKS